MYRYFTCILNTHPATQVIKQRDAADASEAGNFHRDQSHPQAEQNKGYSQLKMKGHSICPILSGISQLILWKLMLVKIAAIPHSEGNSSKSSTPIKTKLLMNVYINATKISY